MNDIDLVKRIMEKYTIDLDEAEHRMLKLHKSYFRLMFLSACCTAISLTLFALTVMLIGGDFGAPVYE